MYFIQDRMKLNRELWPCQEREKLGCFDKGFTVLKSKTSNQIL